MVPLTTYPLFVELLRGPLSNEFGWSDIYLNEGHVIEVRATATQFVALSKLRHATPSSSSTAKAAASRRTSASTAVVVDTRLRPVTDRSALVTAESGLGVSDEDGSGDGVTAVFGAVTDRNARVTVDVCPFRNLQLVIRNKIVADALPFILDMQNTGLFRFCISFYFYAIYLSIPSIVLTPLTLI
jgi:hypothetical protein